MTYFFKSFLYIFFYFLDLLRIFTHEIQRKKFIKICKKSEIGAGGKTRVYPGGYLYIYILGCILSYIQKIRKKHIYKNL
jgi:hypothetical protein